MVGRMVLVQQRDRVEVRPTIAGQHRTTQLHERAYKLWMQTRAAFGPRPSLSISDLSFNNVFSGPLAQLRGGK